VNLATLAVKNVWRNKLRAALTMVGVAIALVAFILLRTVINAWMAGIDYAAKDRLGTRHKISFIMPLPLHYVEEIKQVPGVNGVALAQWFGGKDPNNESSFFATIAVEPSSILDVYPELLVKPEEKQAWIQNKRGALIGDALAKQTHWKPGDRVTLRGTIYPGNWEFEISGIYRAARPSVDRTTFWFHWDYLNDTVEARRKDKVGWIVSRIDNPGRAAEIARAIDAKFEERDAQTLSMSEKALNVSFLGMVSAVLKAIDVVSVVILVIMGLILGNTISMGVRERTHEYGALRAIGFLPRHIALFVLGEAVAIGFLSGVLGLLIGYPFVEQGLGRYLEENMAGFFPYFRIAPATALLALGLAVLLGVVAAAIPAYRAARLNVVDSLRRVG
jgi:putative ABC transport system permease protein